VSTVVARRACAAVGVALVGLTAPATAIAASTYGRLVVSHSAMPAEPLDTHFQHVQPPRSFLLVVTEPRETALHFKWSLRCYNSARRESGGATGDATVASGRWVKQVRANWIEHPVNCTGGIVGSAASSPVLVRIYVR
jgi:hypothetical protein